MKISSMILTLALFLVLLGCGGGGSGGSGGGSEIDPVTQNINATGGAIELSSGFKVTFPEGAVDGSNEVTVSETSKPASLPSGIQAKSPAYKISTNTGQLNMPAELKFPVTESSENVGVYRWDEETNQWRFAGGVYSKEDNTIRANVDGFSTYIIGAGGLKYRLVEFRGYPPFNVAVRPFEYTFANPLQTSRLARQMAIGVWKTPPGHYGPNIGGLPQGSYSFCAEWYNDGSIGTGDSGWFHKFLGDLPKDPAVILGDTGNPDIPAIVTIGSVPSYLQEVGRCPPPRFFVPVDIAEEFDFQGIYEGLDPIRSYEKYHGLYDFRSDNSLFIEEWINGVYYSGTGTWEFNPASTTFSFGVDDKTSFSGPITGTTDSFNLKGNWYDGSAGEIQFSRK